MPRGPGMPQPTKLMRLLYPLHIDLVVRRSPRRRTAGRTVCPWDHRHAGKPGKSLLPTKQQRRATLPPPASPQFPGRRHPDGIAAGKLILFSNVFGAALFYGDRVITPAIPIAGAQEGRETIDPDFAAWMSPVSVAPRTLQPQRIGH